MTLSPARTVLVTGATGTQGGATARHLLHRGVTVRAMTRTPDSPAARALADAGAHLVTGDFDDPASLAAAVDGVDAVFSVQDVVTAGDDGEARHGIALADAAVAAGVSYLVQASGGGADRAPTQPGFIGKHAVERHLAATGIAHTVLAPTWFMSDWEWPYFRPAILAGTLALPLDPDTTLQQIAPTDIGYAAAQAFTDPSTWAGRRVELAGDERSVADIAAALGTALGRPVTYRQIGWDDWRQQYGDFFHGLFRWYAEHGYQADLPALRREIPYLHTFEAYLTARGDLHDDPQPLTMPS